MDRATTALVHCFLLGGVAFGDLYVFRVLYYVVVRVLLLRRRSLWWDLSFYFLLSFCNFFFLIFISAFSCFHFFKHVIVLVLEYQPLLLVVLNVNIIEHKTSRG